MDILEKALDINFNGSNEHMDEVKIVDEQKQEYTDH